MVPYARFPKFRLGGHPVNNSSESVYSNPLVERYASREMATLWGPARKFSTWRRLWVALAEAEAELGLPISQGQIAELRAKVDDVDLAKAAEYERKLRHDVMAHVHTYGDACPGARADHSPGRHELLRHRQHRSDPDPRSHLSWSAAASWRSSIPWPSLPRRSATCRAWASPTCSRPSPRPSANVPACGCTTWCPTWARSSIV